MEHLSSTELRAYITYDKHGRATLNLGGKGLSKVPDAATELSELEVLWIGYNNITEFPTSINKLKNLKRLVLHCNKLSYLPAEIGDLKELTDLELGVNMLTMLPAEVGDMKELKKLWVHGNRLTEVPSSIVKLKKLEELELENNRLITELPANIDDMKELRCLNVNKNQLAEVPTSISKLEKLHVLNLADNRLTMLPAEIGHMKELKKLRVSKNQLTKVPSSIIKLQTLTELNLGSNMLTMLPAEIGDMKELRELEVSNNQLTVLPTSISKLQKLTVLKLGSNILTKLPAEIGDMKELEWLYVGHNRLTVVPASVLKLKKLKKLNLDNNMLSELPAAIGDMTELRQLHVSGNPLTAEALRSLKLKETIITDISVPAEIKARGQRAQLAYQKALSDGFVNVYRGRLLLIGQDRAGKTSLKKSLIGVPFEPNEQSTEGIEVDPSTFQVDVNQVKNWQSINKNKQVLDMLGCSKEVVRMVVEKLQNDSDDHRCDDYSDDYSQDGEEDNDSYIKQVAEQNIDEVSEHKSTQPELIMNATSLPDDITNPANELIRSLKRDDNSDDYSQDGKEGNDSYIKQVAEQNIDEVSEHKSTQHELIINATSPPDQITNKLIKYFRRELVESDIKREESIYYVDLWDFAGQHLYYASHPIFFSLHAIYVLVYNLSKSLNATAQPCVRQGIYDVVLENSNGETNVENLLSWLVTVHSITQRRGETVDSAHERSTYLRPPVIIVGTHADKPCEDIKSMTTQIQKSISGKEYERHVVRPIFAIDNTAARSQQKEYGSGQMPDKIYTRLHKHRLQQVDPATVYGYRELSWKCDNCNGGNKNANLYPYHCNPCFFDLCHSCALKDQRNPSTEIQALQDKIMEVLKQEPYMRKKIPVRWIHFEKIIDALVAQNIHHIDIEKLQTHAKDVCFIVDEEEFETMINFYHDLGIIIKHCTTVILKAQWLIDLFRQLITIPHFDNMDPIVSIHWKEVQDSGVLSMELVDHVFKKLLLQGVVRDDVLNMMERFGLIAKFSPSTTDVKYFVPAQLKESPDDHCAVKPSSSDPCPLYICFFDGFVPHGLFTQLVSHFIRWCSEAGPSQPPTLYRNGAWFVIGRQVVHDFILTCKKKFIKVVLKQRSQSHPVLGDKSTDHEIAAQVREFVDQTLQSLSRNLPYLRGLQYKFHVECPYCDLESKKCTNHNEVSCAHEDCLHLLEITQDNPMICKKKLHNEVLRVDGLEKWFSRRTSQTLNNTGKVPGNLLEPTAEPIVPEEGMRRKCKSPCKEDNAGRPMTSDVQLIQGPAKVPRCEEPATTGQLMDDIQLTQGSVKCSKRKSPCKEDNAGRQTTSDAQLTQGPAKVARYEIPATTDGQVMDDIQPTQGGFFNVLQQMRQLHDARKGTWRNINPSVALKNIASDKGLVVSDNQGGGNCMFYALSEQLGLVKGIPITHHDLRKKVVHYLENNPKLPDGTELFNFVDGYSSWNTYLTNMAADGTWGDHVILHGVANCFGTCIHVISNLSHHNDVIITPERDVASSNPLVLGHMHELHYVSLIPLKPDKVKEGSPSDDELEDLSRKIEDWKSLGRRLKFDKGMLHGFHKDNDEWRERAYAMLITWKEREGSAATYQVLYQALCHKFVNRRDLAEEICCEDKILPLCRANNNEN